MKKNLDITKPRYSKKQLLPVPWFFVISRFHCRCFSIWITSQWNSLPTPVIRRATRILSNLKTGEQSNQKTESWEGRKFITRVHHYLFIYLFIYLFTDLLNTEKYYYCLLKELYNIVAMQLNFHPSSFHHLHLYTFHSIVIDHTLY